MVVCGRFFGIYDLYICVCNFLLMFVGSFVFMYVFLCFQMFVCEHFDQTVAHVLNSHTF